MSAIRMRNLTLASAKHLMIHGHITPEHHQRIVASVQKPKRPLTVGMFGSMAPQQAQAPIPGAAPSQAVPAGTATGYEG